MLKPVFKMPLSLIFHLDIDVMGSQSWPRLFDLAGFIMGRQSRWTQPQSGVFSQDQQFELPEA
jgi:hypothetical protein